MPVDALLHRLRTDNTSGATALVDLAVDIVKAFAEHPPAERDFHTNLTALIRGIIAAQPSMAVMINLSQQVLQTCPDDTPPEDAIDYLQQTLTTFRQHLHSSTEAICQRTLTVLPHDATVLTYSNSTTVIAALQYASDSGHLRRVLLSESRPAYDGRTQASALLAHGIAVEFSVDMGLFDRLPESHVVLVGADAVFPHGLLNKLGTHALAQLAQRYGIPIYSLCATSKFLPSLAASLLRLVDHAPEEVWSDAPASLQIRNRYFDTTPLAQFTGIISEAALYDSETLRHDLQQRALSPVLHDLVSS